MLRAVTAAAAIVCATPAAAQTLAPMQAPGLLGIGPPPVSSSPGDASRETEEQMKAKGLKACKVGDRVLAEYENRWISAQVVEVSEDQTVVSPCRVHFIGRPPSGDVSVPPWRLRAEDARP
ncbi:MAG: hypothetical protein WCP68_08385 [Enhydrobacter sp.]